MHRRFMCLLDHQRAKRTCTAFLRSHTLTLTSAGCSCSRLAHTARPMAALSSPSLCLSAAREPTSAANSEPDRWCRRRQASCGCRGHGAPAGQNSFGAVLGGCTLAVKA